MSQQEVNTEALKLAVEANARMDTHEKVCAERYQEITSGQKDIFKILRGISWGVICLLVSIIGFLLAEYVLTGGEINERTNQTTAR